MANTSKDEEAIFNAAIKLRKGPQRQAYLARACGDDSKLLSDVEALLQAHEAKSLIDEPIHAQDVTLDTSPLTEGPGTIIGNYKLLEQIGEGGMAVVYMAEQEKPLRRRVALKIIKLGMDTKSVIARFEAERQALAVMEHPNIAKVFDAGTTETGRPYFVMELVRGVSISKYCDKNKLDTKERLDLFVQICNAVQHAHQKGIIHRDIKPSNVMVTLRDGKPVPKVIDFGIAKATSQRLTEKTLFTRYAQMIGTPAYMSPEQAEFSELDIDTRTDIYSLGVLLYELLTGDTPFSEEQLREAGYLEMQRIIREEEPTKPSTKLSTLGDTLTDVAEHRKASPDLLQKLVRGDLDWIVMKSLEKDRTRRYYAAAELVADIARHLNNEPVLAGPPSQIYRLRKFIRRHRTQALSAAIVAVLLAGMAVVSVMLFQARNRGEEAEFLKHKDVLLKAMEFRSKGQFQNALSKVEAMLSSEHVGPEARLLHARLVLELQGPADAVKELEKLINERDDIACQAHLLLARIYLESASGDPETTQEYQQKAKEHQQKGGKLFSETVDAYFNQAMIVGTVKKTLECLNKALELEPGHYESREARALAYYALRDYRNMERDAVVMTTLRDRDSLGYSLMAIALRETKYFAEAIEYHNKAIEISPDEAELYDQRRQTYLRIGNYEQALVDARKCVELEPEERIYHFHVFCALVASGLYDEATAKYETIIESGLMEGSLLDRSMARYVSDSLAAGLSWYPPESKPEGAAFMEMHESARSYEQLAKKARRVVPVGFHAAWSPDGRRLAYSRGVLGSSGIEILNLESGETRFLTTPGKDPDWSGDGKYIAYVRDRQMLLLGDIPKEYIGRSGSYLKEEIWIIKADGTEEPRFLARGGWPCWSSDSRRIFYHSRVDHKLCSISIEDGAKPKPIVSCPSSTPAVSPDEKYVAYWDTDASFKIMELSTKSIVVSWAEIPITVPIIIDWSPDGRKLIAGGHRHTGLWIYDLDAKTVSNVLTGSFGKCSWSPVDMSKMAIERTHWDMHSHEIWVANLDPNVSTTESPGTGRTLEEHCQYMVDIYTRQIDVEPESAYWYLSRAKWYIYVHDQEKALGDLEKYAGIVKDPSRIAGGYSNLAWELVISPGVKLFDSTSVVELARKAVELAPKNGNCWSTLGVAYYRAGQWEDAITASGKSMELVSGVNKGICLFFTAMAHWQLGKQEEARQWYDKAVQWMEQNQPDNGELACFRSEAAELLGIAEQPNGKEVAPGENE